MEVTGGLKEQFEQLQEQQKKKLERRKQLKEEKSKNSQTSATDRAVNSAFGVSDDLGLKLADQPARHSSSDDLVDHLNDQIRELKDENGRLYKLLSERDLEVRHLRKKLQDSSLITQGGVSNDVAAVKIVELSKKVRELTAELESERTKSKQLGKKCLNLENELQLQVANKGKTNEAPKTYLMQDVEDRQTVEANLKMTQDKLKQAEMKAAEYRNQCQSLRQELKMANKVIAQEVGEGATVQSLMNATSSWRGRAQQIVTLQKKVNDLRSQLDYNSSGSAVQSHTSVEDEFYGTASSRISRMTADERHKEQLRKIDKERKEAQEKMAKEFKALEQDYESLKSKFDASKARNKVLSTELKTVKQQVEKLLEKGKHDDELIEALLKQQTQLRNTLEETTKSEQMTNKEKEEAAKQLAIKTQQENNLIEQLRTIIADKEAQIKALQMNMKENNIEKSQMNEAAASRGEGNAEQNNSSANQDTHRLNSLSNQEAESLASSRASTVLSRPPTVVCEVNDYYRDLTPALSARPVSASIHSNLEANDVNHHPSSRKTSARSSSRSSATNSARGKRPNSAKRYQQVSLEDLELQCQEYKSLYQAITVERDRLSEFVKVLQSRIDEATQKLAESQTELISERRRNVQLEKQIGKAKIDHGTSARKFKSKTGNSAISLRDSIAEDDTTQKNYEELETNLAIQRDENEALKVALQSTLQSKEEDLHLYSQMIEETKKIFLQGLKQYRSRPGNV